MKNYKKRSPVSFASIPSQTIIKDGWEVVLEYENQVAGTFLIDLSHMGKWDVQGENLSSIKPCGIPVPETPGQCVFKDGVLMNLVKWNWATIWCLDRESAESFQEYAYTDVTEAYALLCLVGKDVFAIMEKITSLDLLSPAKKPPFLLIGPVVDVRCQVVVLENTDGHSTVLIACPRGYGQSVADALLDAGDQWGLQPGGEKVFTGVVEADI